MHNSTTTCQIFKREIHQRHFITGGLLFCKEHQREFKHRQHEGVSTADLDPLWGDTLRNWRERPSELDRELKFHIFAFPSLLREKDEAWLIFVHSFYEFPWPPVNKPSRIIRNPKQDFWWRFRAQRFSHRPHRLSDYLAVNRQTGEIRRFVNVASNEVLDDLRKIRPAPAQMELAPFWGKRRANGIREKILFEDTLRG